MHFTIRNRVPYNKLLTNRACSGRTGEYWPSVVFVRTSLRSVRTVTISGQYSPVRPSRPVSKRLIFRVTGANQNARKLLSTDLLNTNESDSYKGHLNMLNRKCAEKSHFINSSSTFKWLFSFFCQLVFARKSYKAF